MKNMPLVLLLLLVLPLTLNSQAKLAKTAMAGALTTEQLTRQADIVAVGKVSTMRSVWNAEKTRIFTRVTIAVREFLKGGGGERQLTILTPGGEIGEVGELYSNAARFDQEEEVVVFAKKVKGQELQVAGGAWGKVNLRKDKNTQAMIAGTGMTLDALRQQVRTAAQAPAPEEKQP